MTKLKEFMAKIKALIAKAKKFDIYNNGRYSMLVPMGVLLITIICGCIYQFTNVKFNNVANVGVDFMGGTMLTVEFSGADSMNSGDKYTENLQVIEKVLNDKGFKIAVAQSSGESALVVKYLNTAVLDGEAVDYSADNMVEQMNGINNDITQAKLPSAFKEIYGDAVTVKATTTIIGNSASVKLIQTALISTAVALAAILIYIIIRFDFYSGLAAIIALLHDIIIMMCFVVIFYIEISSTIVAAIITIVGYSMNNNIVVFDRLRRNLKPYKNSGESYDLPTVVNQSIFATINRTMFTTFTTLIVIVLIASVGVVSVRDFAFPIAFGLVAGFFSTVFLVCPLWGSLRNLGGKIKGKIAANKNKKSRGSSFKNAPVKKPVKAKGRA